jgi:hypothetical protein
MQESAQPLCSLRINQIRQHPPAQGGRLGQLIPSSFEQNSSFSPSQYPGLYRISSQKTGLQLAWGKVADLPSISSPQHEEAYLH